MPNNPLAVVILADHLYAGCRIWRGIRDVDGIETTLFICNNRWGALKFIAANAYGLIIKAGLTATMGFMRDIALRRLRLIIRFSRFSENLHVLRRLAPDVGLHSMSIIYRKNMIDCFRLGILNPHIGKLPEFRGRSVMEWSLLYGAPTGVTTFFIDAGIDTGKDVLFFDEVPVHGFKTIDSAKDHLFGQNVRCFRKALVRLAAGPVAYESNDVSRGRRFYVMSDLLKDAVTDILNHDNASAE
ncbi:MAG: hypothetical protein AMXMBFR82_50110 [Candidatus Hydrogenedentota bacterium]